jgi:tungstate transport system ATP-binding protein
MSLAMDISGVSKRYRDIPVLDECSFCFGHPGVYALMGPNGSGKSTLLRICALLENPDNGEVLYREDGKGLDHDIALLRRITLVLPRIGLFNTSSFSNAAYGLMIRKERRSVIAGKVESILRRVELHHKKDQNALTLSSGEAQRLGIARALVLEPEVLFLDEPTAFVDARSRAIIDEVILGMRNEGRSIVIISTHDRAQAGRLCDTILTMDDGRIAGG